MANCADIAVALFEKTLVVTNLVTGGGTLTSFLQLIIVQIPISNNQYVKRILLIF
jgi:hypothetical protein